MFVVRTCKQKTELCLYFSIWEVLKSMKGQDYNQKLNEMLDYNQKGDKRSRLYLEIDQKVKRLQFKAICLN